MTVHRVLFQDNSGVAHIVSGPVMQDKIGGLYNICAHLITYVIADKAGLQSTCLLKIKVNGMFVLDIVWQIALP